MHDRGMPTSFARGRTTSTATWSVEIDRCAEVPGGIRGAASEGLAAEDNGAWDAGAGVCGGDPPGEGDPPGDGVPGDGRPGIDEITEALRTAHALLAPHGCGDPLEPATLEQVDAAMAALARAQRVVAAVGARLARCAHESGSASDAGRSSTAAYLRARLGLSARQAKAQEQLALDLAALERTSRLLAAGEIGAEQAAAVGRAARSGELGTPEQTESGLLDAACADSPERLAARIRQRQQEQAPDSAAEREQRARDRRRLSLVKDDDGGWQLHGYLDPESGEVLATALNAFSRPDPPKTAPEQRRRPEQRLLDALTDLAAAALSGGAPPEAGGVRPHLSVVVPIRVLDPDATVLGECAHGTQLSPEAVQRLLCDASVSRIIVNGDSQVLDVGRLTREWNAAQRRAAHVRHGGCRGPGCDRPFAWCDLHHVQWWSRNGRTDLDNALPLCSHCHRLVHDRGWDLDYEPRSGRATFTSPRGRRVTTLPRGIAA